VSTDVDLGQRRKDSVVRLMADIADRDRDAASKVFHEEVAWWAPQSAVELGVPRPVRGREAVLDLVRMRSYQVGTTRWRNQHVLYDQDEDLVVLHTHLEATTNAGLPYDNPYCLVYRFEGDEVIEVWEHADTAYAYSRYKA
jgi:ketosteroid isomerase-like protein